MAMNPAAAAFPAEAAAHLLQGINVLLDHWAALRMAVENQWGGPNSHERPQQLAQSLFLHLTQSIEQVYTDDLEEMIDDFMLNSLNAEFDDGSIEQIAERLVVVRQQCLEGNFDMAELQFLFV